LDPFFDLSGNIALVTGGSRGLGYQMVRAFAERGADVVIASRKLDNCEKVAEEVRALGRRALPFPVHAAKWDEIDRLIDAAYAEFGRVDILVNNAGMSHVRRPMLEVEEAEFDRLMAVNVKSIFLFAHAVVPLMRKQKSGVIINIGSTAGIRPRPGLTWYNASKGAVNLVSKSMAAELAPDGIRVCAIAPVMAETPLLPTFMGGDSPELRAQFKATVPLGRFATIDDVANAALFLASDEASFLTGNVLEVDGGRCV
jgi:3-oxoacyl-[acyl-carrier protein] reductase